MKELTYEQLNEVLEAHRKWIDSERKEGEKAILSGVVLHKAYLFEARLAHADLSSAKLEKANLAWANLQNANLLQACLAGSDLFAANLQGANLVKADWHWHSNEFSYLLKIRKDGKLSGKSGGRQKVI